MSGLTVRPARAGDYEAMSGAELPFRVRALAAEADGRLIGVAGAIFPPGGTVMLFADIDEAMRRHPVALHRNAVRMIADLRAQGIRRIAATCDPEFPAAIRWLTRLGFHDAGMAGDRRLFTWSA